jgi:hypothetical protein
VVAGDQAVRPMTTFTSSAFSVGGSATVVISDDVSIGAVSRGGFFDVQADHALFP